MTEVIDGDNFLVRPQLVPIAEREAMAARIAQVACQLKELIEDPLVKETFNRLPDNGTAIPLGEGYCLTNEGLVWDNRHRIVGGNSLPHFVPVPPTHYQAVVRAFTLTQEELKPEAIISRVINIISTLLTPGVG